LTQGPHVDAQSHEHSNPQLHRRRQVDEWDSIKDQKPLSFEALADAGASLKINPESQPKTLSTANTLDPRP